MRTTLSSPKGGFPTESVIYLDNAATSHPKPPAVYEAMDLAARSGGNPGRGGHRLALAAGRRLFSAREAVARCFGLSDSSRVLFTGSATDSLNLAVKGLLRPGDHCITTTAEHNALRRPLAALERQGVEVTWLPVSSEGLLDPKAVHQALRTNTRLIALAHGSNVTGAVQPVAELGNLARAAGVFLLVDAAQTAGSFPLDMGALGIHLLAVPGHKGLLGPQGVGLLCVDPMVPLTPIREGGTGSLPLGAEQPLLFPEGFESGTLNVPGIAGLAAGVEYLLEHGLSSREHELAAGLYRELKALPGVRVYGPAAPEERTAVVSFTVDGLDAAEVEERLDEEAGICGRAGLHCNPGAHAAIGTLQLGGAMRLSPGRFTTESDMEAAMRAVAALTRTKGRNQPWLQV